jgi:hypothetical protein
MNQDLVTGPEAADLPTRKIKTARSRFILLEQFSNSSLVDQINWDDVILSETDSVFYSLMNAQIAFVRELSASLRPIRTITSIFEIRNSTDYTMFPFHTDLAASQRYSQKVVLVSFATLLGFGTVLYVKKFTGSTPLIKG